MAKFSPGVQRKLSELGEFQHRVQRVHGLVEQLAVELKRGGEDRLSQPVKRAFAELKYQMSAAGFDAMAELAGGMQIAAGRGGSASTKLRMLREGVASLRAQLDMEQRALVASAEREAQEDQDRDAS